MLNKTGLKMGLSWDGIFVNRQIKLFYQTCFTNGKSPLSTKHADWAMVLGSFQCRGVLLLLHIVGQGLAVLAADAGRLGYIFIFSSIFHF